MVLNVSSIAMHNTKSNKQISQIECFYGHLKMKKMLLRNKVYVWYPAWFTYHVNRNILYVSF